jgi:hypothetical protein
VQGEIVGEYLLFNSNEIAHRVKLSVTPSANLSAGLTYYHFDLAEEQYFGAAVDSTDFADEVNLYVDWHNDEESLYLSALAGIAFPGDAAEEAFGTDEATGLIEVLATIVF